MPPRPLIRLRKICKALPEATEHVAWSEPVFKVRRKLFAMYADANNHHGAGRHAVWLKAAPGNQAFMVGDAPEKFFIPPYVGAYNWIGVWLDSVADWEEVAQLTADAHGLVAPKKLRSEQASMRESKRKGTGKG